MTEEIKERKLSEIGKGNEWVRPETMLVIKRKNISYPAYYNVYTGKWGGLLDATIYTGNEVPYIEDGEVVDYREITGVK